MRLSLAEAAALLGESERQVRYQIKTGRLKATKDGVRWVIQRDDLPLSPGQQRARENKARELQSAVEQALAPHLNPFQKKPWTVRSMDAFNVAVQITQEARAAIGLEHLAARSLLSLLLATGRGCYSYHVPDKTSAFNSARGHASDAAVLLILEGTELSLALATRLEREVIPALAGILRKLEKGT